MQPPESLINNIILALSIIFIPSFARIMRSEFLVQRELDYVKNAKLMGAGIFRIIFVHILPNTKNVLLPAFAIGFNNAVLAEAGMSYLSLGGQPPKPIDKSFIVRIVLSPFMLIIPPTPT